MSPSTLHAYDNAQVLLDLGRSAVHLDPKRPSASGLDLVGGGYAR